jgi:FemAB-related protein (PEP-CTERM system-associated)
MRGSILVIPTLPINSPWHTSIEEQAKNSFYYDQRWLEMLTAFYGYRIIPLTVTDEDGQITGFLPLCSVKSPLTGRRLVSLPFSDQCPLLAVDKASAHDLIEQAIRLARQQKVKYLELRTGAHEQLAQRSDLTESNLYVNWSIPLSERAQDVWSKLRKPVQHQIKKSQKNGVHIRVAEKREDMSLYYNLHLRTRGKKHGMPVQSEKYFSTLWDTFAASDTLRLLLAEYEGNTIAGIILFASGTTLHYAYGASDEKHLKLAPNNLLFWDAITWGCEHGYKVFDLGRTACDNEGLMEFKRRWGAVQEPLPYYYYPHTAGLASTSESSRKFRLLTTVWRKLPLAVTAPLGGWLYKHMG